MIWRDPTRTIQKSGSGWKNSCLVCWVCSDSLGLSVKVLHNTQTFTHWDYQWKSFTTHQHSLTGTISESPSQHTNIHSLGLSVKVLHNTQTFTHWDYQWKSFTTHKHSLTGTVSKSPSQHTNIH